MRDIVGMATLAALFAVVARIGAGPSDWLVAAIVASAIAAPFAWYIWRDAGANEGVATWLYSALGSVILGGIFFLIDAAFGQSKSTGTSLWDAAKHSGSPFGIVLTVAICPGSTCVFLATAVRTAYDRWVA